MSIPLRLDTASHLAAASASWPFALLSVWPACSTTRTSNAPTSAHRLTGTIREFPLPSPNQPAGEVSAIPGGRVYMSAGLVSVQGITAGPDGDIWFTEDDENTGKAGRITSTGKITEFVLPATNIEPGAITAGPNEALWFTEGTTGKIGRITKAGQIREFALPGFTVGHEVDYITAGPDGALWFTDLAGVNSKIGRITPSGPIAEYPLPTPRAGPLDITTAPDGTIWFTEFASGRIGHLD